MSIRAEAEVRLGLLPEVVVDDKDVEVEVEEEEEDERGKRIFAVGGIELVP